MRKPVDLEKYILHETANLYLYDTGKALEVRLNGVTHAVLVGTVTSVEDGKRVMEKLEKYPRNLRAFMGWRN